MLPCADANKKMPLVFLNQQITLHLIGCMKKILNEFYKKNNQRANRSGRLQSSQPIMARACHTKKEARSHNPRAS